MHDKDMNLPLVSLRFAMELFQLCADELSWSVEGTAYDEDLKSFLDELDAAIKLAQK